MPLHLSQAGSQMAAMHVLSCACLSVEHVLMDLQFDLCQSATTDIHNQRPDAPFACSDASQSAQINRHEIKLLWLRSIRCILMLRTMLLAPTCQHLKTVCHHRVFSLSAPVDIVAWHDSLYIHQGRAATKFNRHEIMLNRARIVWNCTRHALHVSAAW